MSITSFSKEEITAGLAGYKPEISNRLRIMYVQEHITKDNFEHACRLYSNLKGASYDDVIIIEKFKGSHDKLLPMVSNASFDTPIGSVAVNDVLRNDFCDEDDDFFIDDAGYREDMSIFDQLMMLQCVLDEFRVLSIQVVDMRTSIIRELTSAVAELMRERNALVIICADASECDDEKIRSIQQAVDNREHSRLMNYLNTGDAGINGAGPFAAGILLADNWELDTELRLAGGKGQPFLFGHSCLTKYEKSNA
ncbi:MAG: AmmeMemoRadiSam system protein B [Balneolia bacterium]|nr:AmmeMemoRadiSam system protein B [Balneolia bacterium]